MESQQQQTLQAWLDEYRAKGVSRIKLGLTDVDGVIRGKYVSLEKFASVMHKAGGFCDCVFGWDVDDQLYDAGTYTGWHSGFPDTGYQLVADSQRWLAEEHCPYFIARFVQTSGASHPLCPRTRLQQVLDRFTARGLAVRAGFEYEFFVFDETPHSVRDKGYRGMRPLTPGNFGYSILRTSAESDLFTGLLAYAEELRCDLEGLHCETGPGVWEAALQAQPALEAADRANLFKTFAKVYLQKRQLMGTFMAKWSMDYPGQSGHFHFSVLDAGDANQFYQQGAEAGMSATQRHAVGGLQRALPQLLALLAPTVNSYTRLVKGAWAPTAATWGVENRTTAVRVIPGSEHSQRIECRVPGADANPYLVAAAVLAAALHGIEHEIEPSAPVTGNAYEAQDALAPELQFASNLRTAADQLIASAVAREFLGEPFVEHFGMSRHWECSEYERHINSWQLDRYFEII